MRYLTVMQTPALILVHSPLVGPLTWEATAERLRQLGHLVLVPSLVDQLAKALAGG